jgi:NhaP-type Na+/H+ and K+/H+ antiporter
MFLTLGLLVFPAQLPSVALKGAVLAIVVVFLARPFAMAIATLPFAYSSRERLILGWAGLRGAVPVVLATLPVIEHVPHSLEFFNIVFFALLVSTLVQGSTFETFARRLRLTTSERAPRCSSIRSPLRTRSSACMCAIWACHGTPSSMSSSGVRKQFLHAAPPGCSPATSSTC